MKPTTTSQNKNWILFIIYVILASTVITMLSSCSTRKVVIDEVKKDSLSQISTKTIIDKLSRTETKNDIITDEFTIIPLDTCKDIVVNGITYKNVVLRYKKTKDNTIQVQDIKVSKNELKVQDTKVTQNRKVKDIEKTSNPYWLLLIPFGLYLIYKFLYPPLKNIL
jgi:uncharacterized membrane protein